MSIWHRLHPRICYTQHLLFLLLGPRHIYRIHLVCIQGSSFYIFHWLHRNSGMLLGQFYNFYFCQSNIQKSIEYILHYWNLCILDQLVMDHLQYILYFLDRVYTLDNKVYKFCWGCQNRHILGEHSYTFRNHQNRIQKSIKDSYHCYQIICSLGLYLMGELQYIYYLGLASIQDSIVHRIFVRH